VVRCSLLCEIEILLADRNNRQSSCSRCIPVRLKKGWFAGCNFVSRKRISIPKKILSYHSKATHLNVLCIVNILLKLWSPHHTTFKQSLVITYLQPTCHDKRNKCRHAATTSLPRVSLMTEQCMHSTTTRIRFCYINPFQNCRRNDSGKAGNISRNASTITQRPSLATDKQFGSSSFPHLTAEKRLSEYYKAVQDWLSTNCNEQQYTNNYIMLPSKTGTSQFQLSCNLLLHSVFKMHIRKNNEFGTDEKVTNWVNWQIKRWRIWQILLYNHVRIYHRTVGKNCWFPTYTYQHACNLNTTKELNESRGENTL